MSQSDILLEAGTNELEIVEFYLDEVDADGVPYRGHYGINVAKVLEIIRLPTKVTELPEVRNKAVLGAFNLRSHVIPLVDLSVWLGKDKVASKVSKVIVTEFNNVTTAFMVSGVNRIHRISWEEVESPNSYVSSLTRDTITGVVKIEDRIIFLLDLERIVSDLNPQLGLRLDEAIDWSAGANYRALIAEDSKVIREMIKEFLQKANFEVEAVTTGKEAWDRLVELRTKSIDEGNPVNHYVQVVVSDIEMPQMDGLNLCKRIKEDPHLKILPVILFSSLITDKLRHKGDSVGADDQISKPEITAVAQRSLALIEQFQKSASRK